MINPCSIYWRNIKPLVTGVLLPRKLICASITIMLACGLALTVMGCSDSGSSGNGNDSSSDSDDGGDGDDDGGGGGGSAPPVGSASTSIKLSGTVTAGGNTASGASSSSVGMASSAAATALSEVSVEVWFYKDGELLNPNAPLIATSDENGRFNLAAPEPYQDTTRVVVDFEREGYVLGSRTFRNLQGNESLNLNMILQAEEVEVQNLSDNDGISISSTGERVLRFGVVRRWDGERELISGDAVGIAAENSSNGDLEVGLEIPVASIDTDDDRVQAVTAGIAYFDPFDDEQVQSFPGDFRGRGDSSGRQGSGVTLAPTAGGSAVSSAQIDEEYRIVSTAFTQVRLRDQDGEGLQLNLDNGAGAGIAAASNPTVMLRVPESTYATITHDHDTASAGIQVPIYLYTGSEWRYAGPATLVGSDETQLSRDQYIGADDNVIEDPDWPTPLFARLEIDEGNNWVSWLNIDWPILAGDVDDWCVTANIAYKGKTPVPFAGYVNLTLPDGGRQWIYVNDGKLAEVIPAGSDQDWKAEVWNERTNSNQELDTLTVNTSSTCTPPEGPDNLLTNPHRCRLSGSLLREESPVAGRNVSVSGMGFWSSVFSDDDGRYMLDVPCDADLTLRFGNATKQAKVDNEIGDDESADDGIVVRVDVELENQPPQLSVNWPQILTQNKPSSLSFYAWDPDGDDITVTCTNGCSHEQDASSYLSSSIDFTPDSLGSMTITLQATDEHDASFSASRTIDVEALNRAPRITRVSATVNGETHDLGCSGTARERSCNHAVRSGSDVTYRVFAYDSNDDTVNFDWDWDDGISAAATYSDEKNIVVSSSGEVRVTATDSPEQGDAASSEANIAVEAIQERPPELLYAYLDPNVVTLEGATNAQAVSLVFAADYDFEGLSYSWSIDGEPSLGDNDIAFSRGEEVVLQVVDEGDLESGNYQLRLTVTGEYQGNEEQVSRNLGLSVTAGNVEVIVQ